MRAAGELRRLRSAFREWPAVAVKGFLWKHFDLPRRELVFHSRAGTTIAAPLVRNVGALYTAIEVFAAGVYRCGWELEKEPVVLDIGANIGAWILWIAEQRPGVSGVCFEPDPAAAHYLRRNLEANGLARPVAVREEAVSDRTGSAALFQEEPGAGVSSLHATSSVARFSGQTQVATVAFSDAVDAVDGDLAVVKIDCEGAEYDIVDGSPDESWSRVKRVVMEYHPAPPGRYEALRKRFAHLGFAVVKEDRYAPGLGALWLERTRD